MVVKESKSIGYYTSDGNIEAKVQDANFFVKTNLKVKLHAKLASWITLI